MCYCHSMLNFIVLLAGESEDYIRYSTNGGNKKLNSRLSYLIIHLKNISILIMMV